MEPILSSVCKERETTVTRYVYPMILTEANLKIFWEKSKPFRFLFNTEIRENFHAFLNLFASQVGNTIYGNGLFWVIDDFVGVFYITDIEPNQDCQAHITFFDRRFYGRWNLTRKMLRYLFEKYQFQRISVSLPKYATDSSRKFLTSLGFVYEGRKRKATEFNGERYDVDLFSILAEDIYKPIKEKSIWERQKTQALIDRLSYGLEHDSGFEMNIPGDVNGSKD